MHSQIMKAVMMQKKRDRLRKWNEFSGFPSGIKTFLNDTNFSN